MGTPRIRWILFKAYRITWHWLTGIAGTGADTKKNQDAKYRNEKESGHLIPNHEWNRIEHYWDSKKQDSSKSVEHLQERLLATITKMLPTSFIQLPCIRSYITPLVRIANLEEMNKQENLAELGKSPSKDSR